MDKELKKFKDSFEKAVNMYKVEYPPKNVQKLMKFIGGYMREAEKSNILEKGIKSESVLFATQVLIPYFLSQNLYIADLERRISKLEKNKK